MTREEFQQLCRTKIVFLDGATGTNLQKAGMPTGVCPEEIGRASCRERV